MAAPTSNARNVAGDFAVAADRWAPVLMRRGLCPSTRFLPLSRDEVRSILVLSELAGDWEYQGEAHCERKLRHLLSAEVPRDASVISISSFGKEDDDEDEEHEDLRVKSALKTLQSNLLPRLIVLFSELSGNSVDGGCFVKTQCRSAKDTVFDILNERLLASWRQLLSAWDDCSEDLAIAEPAPGSSVLQPDLLNPRMLRRLPAFREQHACNSFIDAGSAAMRSTDATESVINLVRSTRVSRDLAGALEAQADPYLVVQEWRSSLTPASEFRVFVRGGDIVAVSQYFTFCFFPRLVLLKERVLHAIRCAWETGIWPALKGVLMMGKRTDSDEEHMVVVDQGTAMDEASIERNAGSAGRLEAWSEQELQEPLLDFILDVSVDYSNWSLEDLKGELPTDVSVIELNPWRESTSACLFDWARDCTILNRQVTGCLQRDAQHTPDTAREVEFRIVSQPVPDPLYTMVPAYKRIASEWVQGRGSISDHDIHHMVA